MSVRVMETTILHATDILRWVDGATGSTDATEDKRPIDHALALRLSTRPNDLVVRHRAGATALWRRGDAVLVEGVAGTAERERPADLSFPLSGTVYDPRGRYNPRQISLSAGDGTVHALILFPSPQAIAFGPGGGVLGRVCLAADENPVAWARLTLTVRTGLHSALTFWAQADGEGRFRIAMDRLPPLPDGHADYEAELQVQADLSADPLTPPDLSDASAFQQMDIMKEEHHPPAQQFTTALQLRVKPAQVARPVSVGKNCLALKPA